MLSFVKSQIEKKTRYLKDFNLLLKEYNEEKEIVKGYNGRQVLELLQNCDDEGSTEVLIKLDQESNTITICNDGTPFSQKGYRSLFYSYLSSKTSKRKYIGNKGLGFRSIINWSDQIEIQSNNLSLIYNQENRRNFFYKHFDEQSREVKLKDEGLIETAIPVPFLGIPKIKKVESKDYVTSIIITYKEEFLGSIIKQIKSITPETLFFLKSIERVNFEGFDDGIDTIKIHKEIVNIGNKDFGPTEKIRYNNSTWHIFKKEESFGKVVTSDSIEEEFYQIKIAIEENMAKPTGKLYSFFPTNIYLKQPYILHATFDLDPTRNQLVESEKNEIILKKVVEFTIKLAKYFTKEKVSYKPLQILHHNHRADSLDNLGYYELIEEAYKTEAIFPCVDNEYRTLADVVYYGDGFAKMLQLLNATQILSIHILPLEDLSIIDYPIVSEIDNSLLVINDIINVLNEIAEFPLSIEHRSLFIKEIVKNGYQLKIDYENQLNLLVDRNDKLILGEEYAYTPETKGTSLKVPEYTKIKFINRDLYFKLSELFGYNPEKDKNRSRFVTDKLQGLCNIHSFEPATLAQKIISETNSEIKKPELATVDLIKEMNACLYHNFQFINTEAINAPMRVKVPILTQSSKIAITSETILSSDYPKGSFNEAIFEEIYTKDNYVASPKQLGIVIDNEEDIYKVQDYLLWLKVNEHARYEFEELISFESDDYFKSIHKDVYTRYNVQAYKIANFKDILNKISLEQLILWIHVDPFLKNQLYDDLNLDIVEYTYYTTFTYRTKSSFIKYLIQEFFKVKFTNLLIDEKYSWVNDTEINYRHPLLVENDLTKSSIQEILVSLGAKDNFNDLPIEKVVEIINRLPEKYPNGARSTTFYKKALSHYKENEIQINEPLQLFADNGVELNVYSKDQIYFSEKIKLPNKLKKDFPIFNFPPRSGGVEAIKFFGINDLKDVEIKLSSYRELNKLTENLNEKLQQLKPFILTHRIHDFDDLKSQQTQASICNKINLVLCSELDYNVNEKLYQTSLYEYVHYKEQTYYMKVSSSDDISNLTNNSDFTDNIAEILALAFDVKGDKTEFRNIIRSSEDVVRSDIIKDFGEDTLKEAKELLGLADYKQAFWKAICTLKSIEYDEGLDDIALESLINEKLMIDFGVAKLDYESLSSRSQINKLKNLFDQLTVSLSDFSEIYPYKISYKDHHFKTIRDIILSNKLEVKTAIWKQLEGKNIEAKKEFLTEINRYELYEDFANINSEKFKHEFQIDEDEILTEFILSLYPSLEINGQMDFNELLKQNRIHFSKQEQDIINQDVELKSLLYFNDMFDELKELVKAQLEKDSKNLEEDSGVSDESGNKTSIVSSEKLKNRKKTSRKNRKRKPYLPGKEDNRKQKEIGNASEDYVMKYLKDNKYKNIYKASDDNEGLHYDIRFTDENGNIKFIEVKTFNHGMFYLSKEEYAFGKENQEDYEIWLVEDKSKIIPIKDFYNNSKYDPIINEYIVYLDTE